MRRTSAFLLFGGIPLLIGSYLIWAALPFMRPIFIYSRDVPADARTVINQWRGTSMLLQPEPFSEGYLRSLAEPFERKLKWLNVEMDSPDTVKVDDGPILFRRDPSGHWTGWYHGCFGINPLP